MVRRNPSGPENRSSTLFPAGILLEAGHRYYFEALLKEGGGGDHISIAWQGPGDPIPTNGIPGVYLASVSEEAGPEALVLIQHPADQTVEESHQAILLVLATTAGEYPIFYQWFSNGVELAGANLPYYETSPQQPSNTGDRYYCYLSVPGRAVTTAEATLEVVPDITAPVLLGYNNPNYRKIALCFDERLDMETASRSSNYRVDDGRVTVTNVILDPGGRCLALELNTPLGEFFELVTTGLTDLAGNSPHPALHLVDRVRFPRVDVGRPTPSGASLSTNNVDFEVTVGGGAIGTNQDAFHFVYTEIEGPFDIKVKVVELQFANTLSKAGLMVRESLDAASATLHSLTARSAGSNTLEVGRRGSFGAATIDWNIEGSAPVSSLSEIWLRLRRIGHLWSAYWGTNGLDWTLYATASQAMPPIILVGLATTSHNTNQPTVARYEAFGPFAYANASIVIEQQPVDASVSAGQSGTFSVVGRAVGVPPEELGYQWQKDGRDILGANSASLTTRPLYWEENGSEYRVLLLVSGASAVTSVVASVTVTASETVPPELVGAQVDPLDLSRVTLVFSEPMVHLGITNVANYGFSHGAVSRADQSAPDRVTLTVSGLTGFAELEQATIDVSALRDLNGNLLQTAERRSVFLGPLPILFLVDVNASNPSDLLIESYLESRGLPVEVRLGYVEPLQNKSLVLLSSTLWSSSLGPTLRDVGIPVLTWEPQAFAPLQFTESPGFDLNDFNVIRESITMSQTSHPLTAGFAPGPLAITSKRVHFALPSGDPFVAVRIPRSSGFAALIFGYETGARMRADFRAPSRRVGFYWLDDTAAIADPAEWKLFEAAVNWSLIPIILEQPQSLTAEPGSDITLRVIASSATPPTFQWRLNGQNIPGATHATYVIPNASPRDGGTYTAVVANQAGPVLSKEAVVVVTSPELALADNFADRTGSSSIAEVGSGNNVGATDENEEPIHAGKQAARSVWHSWTAPNNGVASFSARGSTFDTLLAVYTGITLDTLMPVVSDEDRGGFFTSQIAFNAEAGQTYQIAIDGFNNATGHIVLSWELEVGAVRLPTISVHPKSQTVNQGTSARFGVNATTDGGELSYQWYFRSQPLADAINPALTVSNADRDDVGGYYVIVRNTAGGTAQSQEASLEIGPAVSLLSQDKLADLFALGSGGGSGGAGPVGAVSVALGSPSFHLFDNLDATVGPEDAFIAGTVGTHSRWIGRFIPDHDATMQFDTVGTDFDTTMAVYHFGAQGLRLLGENNDAADGVLSFVEVEVNGGDSYIVAVDGPNAGHGIIQLNWRLGFKPVVTAEPAGLQVMEGGEFVLRVTAVGTATGFGYQWLRNGQELEGATGPQLALSGVGLSHAGRYQARISNLMGQVLSGEAELVVEVPLILDPKVEVTRDPSGRVVRVQIESHTPHPVVVEVSGDLRTWFPVYTNDPPTTPLVLIDDQAIEFPVQFYRLRPLIRP